MSEERQYNRVINTKDELKYLVSIALEKGRLDLGQCKIDVDFNLAELLLACGQKKVPCEKKGDVQFSIECPFGIYASLSYFTKNVSGFNESFMENTAITFIGELKFLHTTFEQRVDFSYATFLDTIECFNARFKTNVDFKKSHFSQDIYFDSANFEESAGFESATFEGKLIFRKAVFDKEAYFSNAHFRQTVDFENAIFKQTPNFSETLFQETTDFQSVTFFNGVSFSEAKFKNQADFSKAIFTKEASFSHTTFDGKANFYNATFEVGASFEYTDFNGTVDFWASTFKQDVHFFHTEFVKSASFKDIRLSDCSFWLDHCTTQDYLDIIPKELRNDSDILIKYFNLRSEKPSLVVDLENCSPESKGTISFENIEMDEKKTCIKLRNIKSDSGVEVHFSDCNFYGENVVLRNVDFEKINIEGGTLAKGFDFGFQQSKTKKHTLDWFGISFRPFEFEAIHEDTDKILKSLVDETKKVNKPKMWASIYANLKAKVDNDGEKQLGNDYYFWQQYFQCKTQNHPFFNKFYLYTSAYGLSSLLPFCCFVLVFVIGGTFYNFLGDFATVSITSVQKSFCSQIMEYVFEIKGYIVSISASIPFIFFSDSKLVESLLPELPENAKRLKTGLFYFGYIVQHLIQGYLLFQIGAAIRNKVKR